MRLRFVLFFFSFMQSWGSCSPSNYLLMSNPPGPNNLRSAMYTNADMGSCLPGPESYWPTQHVFVSGPSRFCPFKSAQLGFCSWVDRPFHRLKLWSLFQIQTRLQNLGSNLQNKSNDIEVLAVSYLSVDPFLFFVLFCFELSLSVCVCVCIVALLGVLGL